MNGKILVLLVCFMLSITGCDIKLSHNLDGTKTVSSGEKHAALEFTSDAFRKEVIESSQLVLVDFWGPG